MAWGIRAARAGGASGMEVAVRPRVAVSLSSRLVICSGIHVSNIQEYLLNCRYRQGCTGAVRPCFFMLFRAGTSRALAGNDVCPWGRLAGSSGIKTIKLVF